MLVELQSFVFSTNYNGEQIPSEARLYASASFIGASGRVQSGAVGSNEFYKKAAVTLTDKVLTIGAFSSLNGNAVDSTVNSGKANDCTYTLALYDADGNAVGDNDGVIFYDIRVPDTLTPTTWLNLQEFSQSPNQVRSLVNTLSADSIYQILGQYLNAAIKASAAFIGVVKLTTDPVDANDPRAVGANDVRYLASLQTKQIGDYANLAAAQTAIGNVTDTVLEVPNSITVSSMTLTENIRLKMTGTGLITVPNGQTLTIENGAGIEAPNGKQIFNLQGTGKVVFTKSYPETLSLEMFGAKGDNATDDLPAWNKLMAAMGSVGYSGSYRGGTLRLNKAIYYMSATPVLSVPMKIISVSSKDTAESDSGIRVPANTKGLKILSSANGYEIDGIGIFGSVNDAAFNTTVSTTSGSLVINLTGGAIQLISPDSDPDAATGIRGVPPGASIYLNGFNYLLAANYASNAGASAAVVRPRLILGRGIFPSNALASNQIGNVSNFYSGGLKFPTNNDWAGQTIKINGDATYSIVSNTADVITLNKDVPVGQFYCEIMGIKTMSGQNARINLYHGIDVGGQGKLKNVYVGAFAGAGIAYYTDHAPFNVNVNNSTAERVVAQNNRGSGFVFYGIDSNNVRLYDIDAQQNRGAAVFSAGNFGNNFYGYHFAWNWQGGGDYFAPVADDWLMQGYTEGGQPPIIQSNKTIAIGGDNQAGFDRTADGYNYQSVRSGKPAFSGGLAALNDAGQNSAVDGGSVNTYGTNFSAGLPTAVPNTIYSFGAGDEPVNASAGQGTGTVSRNAFVFGYNNVRRGLYSLFYQEFLNNGSFEPQNVYAVSGGKAFEGANQFFLFNGSYFGLYSTNARRKWDFSNSLPSQFFAEQGDVIWNRNATATNGAPIGYVGTTTGTIGATGRTLTTSVPAAATLTGYFGDLSFLAAGNGFVSGTKIRLTTTGTLPAPLQLATDYYTSNGTSNGYFFIYASLDDLANGKVIPLTAQGTGTLTATPRGYVFGSAAHGLKNGQVGQLTTTGTLPTGFSLATDYYPFDVSTNSFRLATSLSNAQMGIGVDYTAAGTGTLTFTPSAGAVTPFGAIGISAGLSATASLDFPSIAAQATSELTIAVPGASVGDVGYWSSDAALEAGLVNGGVTVLAANVATIRIGNITAGAINPSAKNFKVWVIK